VASKRPKFRAITVFHPRNIHESEGEHPILDNKSEFTLAHSVCADSRQKIREAKEEYWDERGRHRTPDEVLVAIRKHHRAGRSLRSKKVPVWLYEIGRLFGTGAKAAEAGDPVSANKLGLMYDNGRGVKKDVRKAIEWHTEL
jgi:hypothetical protein